MLKPARGAARARSHAAARWPKPRGEVFHEAAMLLL
jgi:hypothetical protein